MGRMRLLQPRRLRDQDVLILMLEEHRATAVQLEWADAEARISWMQAASQLLAAVPRDDQRLAWAVLLADAVPGIGSHIFQLSRLLLTPRLGGLL